MVLTESKRGSSRALIHTKTPINRKINASGAFVYNIVKRLIPHKKVRARLKKFDCKNFILVLDPSVYVKTTTNTRVMVRMTIWVTISRIKHLEMHFQYIQESLVLYLPMLHQIDRWNQQTDYALNRFLQF
jgi:hypothetical protein